MEFSQKFCLHDICKVLIHWPAWCCGWSIGPCRRNRLCFGACFGHFGLCACSQLMVVFLATLWVRQGLKCLIDQMKGFLESASQTAKKETYGLQWCSVLWVYDLSAVQCCTSISLKSSLRRKKKTSVKLKKLGTSKIRSPLWRVQILQPFDYTVLSRFLLPKIPTLLDYRSHVGCRPHIFGSTPHVSWLLVANETSVILSFFKTVLVSSFVWMHLQGTPLEAWLDFIQAGVALQPQDIVERFPSHLEPLQAAKKC